MPRDFRASQLQTSKIIASGAIDGTVTNARLLVYPIEAEDTGTPNQGFINTSAFGLDGIGQDVFMFVSGGIGGRGDSSPRISVFGGDLHISGNLSVDGAITPDQFRMNLLDYAVTANTSSNPEVVAQFVFPGNEYSGTLELRGILSTTNPSAQARMRLWNLTTPGYVEIGGPGVIELVTNNLTPTLVSSVDLIQAVNFDSTTQALYELHLYTSDGNYDVYGGGWELRPFGTFSLGAQAIKQWIEGSPSPRIRTTGSVAIGADSVFAEDSGEDVFLFVSGTRDDRGTSGSKIALFNGDLYTSGALFVGPEHSFARTQSSLVAGVTNTIEDALGSAILGGVSNAIRTKATGSFIGGGFLNTISSSNDAGNENPANLGSFIVGGSSNTIINKTNSNNPIGIVGGQNNQIVAGGSGMIVGGSSNTLSTSLNVSTHLNQSVIVGGSFNTISASMAVTTTQNFIGSGLLNKIVNINQNFIGSGNSNSITNSVVAPVGRHFIGAGNNNTITVGSSGSAIVAGAFNEISGSATTVSAVSFIGAGQGNKIEASLGGASANSIVGGIANNVSQSYFSAILGGNLNIINAQRTSAIIAGVGNELSGTSAAAINLNNLIGAGSFNKITTFSSGSAIIAGASNEISGTTSQTISGLSLIGVGVGNKIESNTVTTNANIILGGQQNNISASHVSSIISGQRNVIGRQEYSAIIAGRDNIVTNAGGVTIPLLGSFFIGAGNENEIRTASSGSSIVGGFRNTISSSSTTSSRSGVSFIGGGVGNKILTDINGTHGNSIVGGINNIVHHGHLSFIGGGDNHVISGSSLATMLRNSIVGGNQNSIMINPGSSFGMIHNFIGGGLSNTITGSAFAVSQNSILGGFNNIIFDTLNSNIGGGRSNRLSGAEDSLIAGGRNNLISGALANFNDDQVIVGGFSNAITSSVPGDMYRNFIGGGENNQIRSTGTATHNNVIIGGRNNTLIDCADSVVIGSNTEGNTISNGIFLGGGIYNNYRNSTVNGNITLLNNDMIINVTVNSSAAFTITAPPFGRVGRTIIVSNSTGTSKTINSVVMADGVSRMFYYDSGAWRVLG